MCVTLTSFFTSDFLKFLIATTAPVAVSVADTTLPNAPSPSSRPSLSTAASSSAPSAETSVRATTRRPPPPAGAGRGGAPRALRAAHGKGVLHRRPAGV